MQVYYGYYLNDACQIIRMPFKAANDVEAYQIAERYATKHNITLLEVSDQ